jgi:hypothetical protein
MRHPPRSITILRPGGLMRADSPAAMVVTTWLLIAQKLAETTPTEVDRIIRKAYQRTGRAGPEVRFVRIRGFGPPSGPRPVAKPATGQQQPPDRHYRWWVRFGPGSIAVALPNGVARPDVAADQGVDRREGAAAGDATSLWNRRV